MFTIGCGNTSPSAVDAPAPIADAFVVMTGHPLTAGDTITARTNTVELAVGDSSAAVAVWLDADTSIAHAAVVDFSGHVIGAPYALGAATGVRALSLANQLAVGIATADHHYRVVAITHDDLATEDPVELVTPSQDCEFAVPDHLLCTLPDGTSELGAIAADSSSVAFGAARALGPLAFGVRATSEAVLFADPDGCAMLAKVDDQGAIGAPALVTCLAGGPPDHLVTALEPMPTQETAFARVYVGTHHACAIEGFTANLVKTELSTATDDDCPAALAWDGFGNSAAITIGANGTAAVTGSLAGDAPSPVLGIGNLKGADITLVQLVAITDGERIQFAFQDGIPL